MANQRTIARIEGAIKRRVAHCLQFEVADPRAGFVTIIAAELTPDLAKVTVRWSVLDPKEERVRVGKMLEHARGFVQRKMGRVLSLRRMPRLEWKYDDTGVEAARMDLLIRDALTKDAGVRGDTPETAAADEHSHSDTPTLDAPSGSPAEAPTPLNAPTDDTTGSPPPGTQQD
ncbi:MAG TPA: 30S ribosome-binding factor RbfA [Planctomycetes bacterium]|nr:30S ribosome-binding factor RbfA [Planctomycetota bacterium]HIL38464.1 30S ribosome-binding factor RbfA [Planctomycetota bacterium]